MTPRPNAEASWHAHPRADWEISAQRPADNPPGPQLGSEPTAFQQAAYDAQLAAGLPLSELATAILGGDERPIDLARCAGYLHAIQCTPWFTAAFTGYTQPVIVVGGPGISHADASQRLVTIGADDRWDPRRCEHACLHELAHIVTPDHGPDRLLREPAHDKDSRGHHPAWQANFTFIVQMTLGSQAAHRLRHEFAQWDPANAHTTPQATGAGADTPHTITPQEDSHAAR